MRFYAFRSTPRLLQYFAEDTGVPPSEFEPLAEEPRHHVRLLVVVAHKLRAQPEPLRRAFGHAATALLSDPDRLRELARSDHAEIVAKLDDLFLVAADGYVEHEMSSLAARYIPEGCELDSRALRRRTVAIMQSKATLGNLREELGNVIKAHPKTYIANYEDWMERRSAQLCDDLRYYQVFKAREGYDVSDLATTERAKALLRENMNAWDLETYVRKHEDVCIQVRKKSESLFDTIAPRIRLPGNRKLLREACIAQIQTLLDAGASPDGIPEQLAAEIQAKPRKFIAELEAELRMRAHEIFREVEPQVQPMMPSGHSLIEEECVETLLDLMKDGTDPKELIEAFFQEVGRSKDRFIRKPLSLLDTLESSSPYSSGSSDSAQLSSGPWRKW